MEIIPAILPKDYEDLKNKIALVRGVVPIVQVDICDGIFVPSRTWPFSSETDQHFKGILNEQEGMPFWEDIDFELDLMVVDGVENFDLYTKLGAKRIIFHIETINNLEDFRDFLEGIDVYIREMIQIGVAINPTTPLENIFPLIPFIDFVQCMTIARIGFQGEPFCEEVLKNIEFLKNKFPELTISVDGGINFDSASKLILAGADRLVVGSAIFNTDDIINTIDQFRDL